MNLAFCKKVKSVYGEDVGKRFEDIFMENYTKLERDYVVKLNGDIALKEVELIIKEWLDNNLDKMSQPKFEDNLMEPIVKLQTVATVISKSYPSKAMNLTVCAFFESMGNFIQYSDVGNLSFFGDLNLGNAFKWYAQSISPTRSFSV